MLIQGPIVAARKASKGQPRATPPKRALIGPNAVLQSVPVIHDVLGHDRTDAILDDAQISALPSGDHMIPEIHALRLQRWLALHEPIESLAIAATFGARTADYIISNRIPRAAAWVLRRC